jgi:excisionase family DNA binding protein
MNTADAPDRSPKLASSGLKPLTVSPRTAGGLLEVGNTKLWELIRDAELDTIRIGRSRRILVASIHTYIARRLAAERVTP